jgi:hypothetical protein
MFSPHSRSRLTAKDLARFPGGTVFDRLGRAICGAGVLPRKELYESWEVARRARRLFRGGRVVDVAGGHGLLAYVMLLLDDSSPTATVIDPAITESSTKVRDGLVGMWPRLAGRVTFVTGTLEQVTLSVDDVVVSSHACGALTDAVIDAAASVRARLAVLPCCHDVDTCDAGSLTGWMDAALAIDARRATHLEQRGYRVWTQTIPAAITPKNRLLLGAPRET